MNLIAKFIFVSLLAAMSQSALAGWLPDAKWCQENPDSMWCGVFHQSKSVDKFGVLNVGEASPSLLIKKEK